MKENTTNVKEILAHSALFKMLDERQLDAIAANTYSLRAGPNMRIVKPGDSGEGTYWIAYGQVKIFFYPQKGCEKTVEILGDGTCFGVGEMLSGKPHLAYVKTTTDCLVLHIGRDAMLQAARAPVKISVAVVCRSSRVESPTGVMAFAPSANR